MPMLTFDESQVCPHAACGLILKDVFFILAAILFHLMSKMAHIFLMNILELICISSRICQDMPRTKNVVKKYNV